MPIQESDPERRNLMLSSLGFIVFFFADGELKEAAVRIQVVNIHFNKPEILGVLAWCLLFWFLYRYWLKHSGEFKRYYFSEWGLAINKPYIHKYVSKDTGINFEHNNESGYLLQGVTREGFTWAINYGYSDNIERNKDGTIRSARLKKDKEGLYKLKGFRGRLLTVRAIIHSCFAYPSFSTYIVPYILFAIALTGAMLNWLNYI